MLIRSKVFSMSCEQINKMLQSKSRDFQSNWKSRQQRSDFLLEFCLKKNVDSVLNLGSGGERALLTPSKIRQIDVDFQGDVDVMINLDEECQLPFYNSEFNMVCAMDVLEHLENLHFVFEEMVRCSNKYILISLPNSAAEIPIIAINPKRLRKNSEWQGYYSKYYGLPFDKQLDRHRHWLYLQDIVRFFEYQAKRFSLRVEYVLPKVGLKQRLLRKLIGKRLYYTFFLSHVCLILEKRVS